MDHDPGATNDPAQCDDQELVVALGDAAELTLGNGRARNENKRHPYN